MSRYCAVRCPGCLLTIYSIWSPEHTKGFNVVSLPKEDLAFYNCPFHLCDYHVNTNRDHEVNLYSNIEINPRIQLCNGFTVVPRTAHTEAFRSKAQVDALGITDEDLRIKPPVPEAQVGDKAQGPKDPGEKDGQGDAPVSAGPQAVRISRSKASLADSTDCSDPTKERNHPWAEVDGRRDGKGQAYGQ